MPYDGRRIAEVLASVENLGADPLQVGFGASWVLEFMGELPERARVSFFQILSDHFCPACGREQPPGDCQCASQT